MRRPVDRAERGAVGLAMDGCRFPAVPALRYLEALADPRRRSPRAWWFRRNAGRRARGHLRADRDADRRMAFVGRVLTCLRIRSVRPNGGSGPALQEQ